MMNKEKKSVSLDRRLSIPELFRFYKKIGVNPKRFFFSVFLSFLSTLAQVASLRMLMFLLQGMMHKDFTYLKHAFPFKYVGGGPRELFSSNVIFSFLLAFIFLLALLKSSFQYFSSIILGRQIRQTASNFRQCMFERFLIFGKLYYDRMSIGRVTTILLKFSEAASLQLNVFHRLLAQILSLLVYLLVMFFISWKMTLVTLLVFPPFALASRFMMRKFAEHSRMQVKMEEELDARAFGVLSSIALVKTHSFEQFEKDVFREMNELEVETTYRMDLKEKMIQPVQELGSVIAFLVLAIVAIMVLPNGGSSVAGMLVFFYVLRLALPGVGALPQAWTIMHRALSRIERIQSVFDDQGKGIVEHGVFEFSGLKKEIEFRDLTFNYPGKKPVLERVSFRVEKGKVIAIVGPTGAGKTTLLHLLMRFYDCPSSTIFFDGVDIRKFSLNSLMRRMAFVSQEALFFPETIRYNLTYGLTSTISETVLEEVLRKTRLFDYVMGLPDKWDTLVGDRGVQLSGGERQRLAIARALLRGADIFILDEATSALDSSTEKLVQEAINEAIVESTGIVIAHRLSTIQHADKIFVLEEGRLVEEGNLQELLAKKGKFYGYWNEQKFF